MKRTVAMKFSMLTVLLFMATLLPIGTAHAYLYDSGTSGSSDYYSQYYGDSNTGETANNNPDSTTNNQSGAVDNESNTGTTSNSYSDYYSDRSDYYSRYDTGNSDPGTTPSQPDSTPSDSNNYSDYYDRSGWYDRYNNDNNSGTTTPSNGSSDNTPAPSTPDQSNNTGDVGAEKQMLDMVNQEREKAGLHTFSVDSELVRLARMKSQDMYENNYFSHTSPTYGSAYNMEKEAGYNARVMGAENIAKAANVSRAHTLFMNSDGHRANIMDSRHDVIGVGIVDTPNGVYVTQLFAGN